MTDPIAVALITGLTLLAANVATNTANVYINRKNSKTLDHVETVAVATHVLTNSQLGVQILAKQQNLEVAAVFAHELAKLRGSPADVTAAAALDIRVEAAKKEYEEHQARQAQVDAQEKRGA